MDAVASLGLSAFTGRKGGFQCSLCSGGKAGSKKARLFKSEAAIAAHIQDYHKIVGDEIVVAEGDRTVVVGGEAEGEEGDEEGGDGDEDEV